MSESDEKTVDPKDDELLEELRGIRRSVNNYTESSLNNNKVRRVENVQVLIALGVIGAITTFMARGGFPSVWIKWSSWIMGGSALIFLVLKVVLGPLRLSSDSKRMDNFDNYWLNMLQMFSLILAFVVVPSITLEGLFKGISDYIWMIATFAFVIGSAILSYVWGRKYGEYLEEKRNEEESIEEDIEAFRHSEAERILGENPELIEKGLQILEQQPAVGDMRPDMIARDRDGKLVVAEIKTVRPKIDDFRRLRDYVERLEEEKGEEVRGILVGPGVRRRVNSKIRSSEDLQFKVIDFHKLPHMADEIKHKKWDRTDNYLVQKVPDYEGDNLIVTSLGSGKSEDRVCPTDYPQIGEKLLEKLLNLEEDEEIRLRMRRHPRDIDKYIIEDIID
jgi:hypothetical protein